MLYRSFSARFAAFLLAFATGICAYAESSPDYPVFPQPAPPAYGVCGVALGDGRLLVWNGDAIYVEQAVGSRAFEPVAAGYLGDPGFAALSPDGTSVLLGAGFSGNLYLFDSGNPTDYAEGSVAGTAVHYAGAFLSETLVLLDAGKADYSGSELVIFDLSAGKKLFRPVVWKPVASEPGKDLIIDKPPQSWSSGLAVDYQHDRVYAMDANTRELRAFSVSGLVAAYQNSVTLDWATDGILIGAPEQYFTGGVSGITADGLLIIGGSAGYLLPGGIQLVHPDTGAIAEVLDPGGAQGFYTAIYNPVLREITAVENGTAYLADVSPAVFRCSHFPAAAVNAYGVAGKTLESGALSLWNGGELFVQCHPRADGFVAVAEGYMGDPGFMAQSPSGDRIVLGAGFSGLLYGVDPVVFDDYSEGSLLGTANHYAGDFLSETVLLLDAGKPDFSGSELVAFEIGVGKTVRPRALVRKSGQYEIPKDRRITDKPPYSYSSNVFTDHASGVVYAMDANTRELRRFTRSALLAAYASEIALDWQTDGTLIGQPGVYFTGGVSGITPSGLLIIGGSEGYLLPGGIQLIDPGSGAIVITLDPAENAGFYNVVYQASSNMIFATTGGETWALDLDKLGFGEEEGENPVEGEGEGIQEGEGEGETPPEYLVSVRVQGQGTITPPAGSYSYSAGTIISIYATPAEGWTFARWEIAGSGISTDNPLIAAVDGTLDISAVFTEAAPKSPWCCGGTSPRSGMELSDGIIGVLLAAMLLFSLRRARQIV